jgi:putative membrane protein insertion efficiency factor
VDDVEIGTPLGRAPRAGPVTRLMIALLGIYRRWVSPMFLPHCRFHPSCSAYAVEALQVHGLLRGTGLAVVRLLKCAPWHPGGLDPVPPGRSRDPDRDLAPDPEREPPVAGGPPTDPTDRTAPRGAAAPTSEERASC